MKQYLTVLGILGVITAAIVVFVMRDSAATSKRQTAEAQPVGLVAMPTKWWDGDDHVEGHNVTFAWVDGANAVHTERMDEITWFDPARSYKVCYNPQQPAEDWKLYPADHACGS
jgi:hypothetical protein